MKYIPILLLILISCQNTSEEFDQREISYQFSDEVQTAIDSLKLIKHVSYEERQSPRYDSLIKYASINDLRQLMFNEDKYIRTYAYLGLIEKNYPKIQTVFRQNFNDTAVIKTTMSDMIGLETVSSFMLQKLHPVRKQDYSLTDDDFNLFYVTFQKRDKSIAIREKKINWDDTINKRQHLDILYTQKYYWANSDDTDFENKKKAIKKNLPFIEFDDNILVTAYFEGNGCHPHFPNMERRGDTIILRNEILTKYPCDFNLRVIEKVNFVIFNQYIRKIKKVVVE